MSLRILSACLLALAAGDKAFTTRRVGNYD
jgi:hypothetical protein